MSCKSYILTVHISCNTNAIITQNLMSPNAVSGRPKCYKICYWLGLCPGPCWRSSHRYPDPISPIKMGKRQRSFPGPHDVWGPHSRWQNKTNCLSVSLINKTLLTDMEVMQFVCSCCQMPDIALEYWNVHMCLVKTTFLFDVRYFLACVL